MAYRSPQLNDADLELLSSYLDGQVTPAERAALEARLQHEPELRRALDELRATVTALRELPPVRPPRSFTLDPAQHRPRGWAWARWLQMGSALCALLLGLTITFELAGRGTFDGAPRSAAPAPAAPTAPAEAARTSGVTSAPASVPSAAPAEAPAVMQAAAPTAAPAATAAPAPTEPSRPAAGAPAPAGTPGAEMTGAAAPAPGAATNGEATGAAPMVAATAEAVTSAPGGGAIATSASTSPGRASVDTSAMRPAPPAQPGLAPLRVAQILLGLLAAALLVVAFALRRRA